jgi:hypothetical protein
MTGVLSTMVMAVHRHLPLDTSRRAGHADAEPQRGPVVAERPTLADRIAARWRPRRLDRALAQGAPPEASPALALRARRLTELPRRRSLAGAVCRIVREAHEGSHRSRAMVQPDRNRVEAARDELTALADGLADPRPATAHGVAQAWLLVTDGTGPLYNPRSPGSLRAGAARAARELRPWPA